MASLRIIFAGSGEFGLATLVALIRSEHQLVQVITQPDRPAGRGRALSPTPIAAAAAVAGVASLKTADVNRESLLDADVMLVIAFGQKIAPHQVNRPRLGSINLHASLLPKYRGAAPINWAIIRGETIAGNSIIRLAEKMDAGAILAQSSVPISKVETAGELHDRLALDGAPLVMQTLDALSQGKQTEALQDESLATLAPKLSREAAILDFNRPADEISRRIRGLYPWPGCRVILRDAANSQIARLRLVRARPAIDDEGDRWQPGELMVSGMIRTPQGAVEILELQPDGRTPMSLAGYRRGNRWEPGMNLASE